MAAQFEAEIRNSIGQLQSQISSLERATAKAQASMARLGTQTKAAAAGSMSLNQSMEKVTAAAGRTGGAIGTAVGQTLKMAVASPQLLAVGAAMGVIASKAGDLLDRIIEVNKELPNVAKIADEIQRGLGRDAKSAALGSDPAGRARAAFDATAPVSPADAAAIEAARSMGVDAKTARRNLNEFRKSAPNAKLDSDQAFQVAAGYGNEDSTRFQAFANRYTGSAEGQATRQALDDQAAKAIGDQFIRDELVKENAGMNNYIKRRMDELVRKIDENVAEQGRERISNMLWNAIGITSDRQEMLVRQHTVLMDQRDFYRAQQAESSR